MAAPTTASTVTRPLGAGWEVQAAVDAHMAKEVAALMQRAKETADAANARMTNDAASRAQTVQALAQSEARIREAQDQLNKALDQYDPAHAPHGSAQDDRVRLPPGAAALGTTDQGGYSGQTDDIRVGAGTVRNTTKNASVTVRSENGQDRKVLLALNHFETSKAQPASFEVKQGSASPTSFRMLFSNSDASAPSAVTASYLDVPASDPRLQIGTVTADFGRDAYFDDPRWLSKIGFDKPLVRLVSKRVDFVESFVDLPRVVLFLTGFTMRDAHNIRIVTSVTDLSPTGFTALLWYWQRDQTNCASMSLAWAAHDADDPTIRSGTIRTLRDAHDTKADSPFQRKSFDAPLPDEPDVFLSGFSFLDVDNASDPCVFLEHAELDKAGFG